MRPILIYCVAVLAAAQVCSGAAPAFGQMPGQGGMGGRTSGMSRPSEEIQSTPAVDKPDAAATKAYTAGKKSLAKASRFVYA